MWLKHLLSISAIICHENQVPKFTNPESYPVGGNTLVTLIIYSYSYQTSLRIGHKIHNQKIIEVGDVRHTLNTKLIKEPCARHLVFFYRAVASELALKPPV